MLLLAYLRYKLKSKKRRALELLRRGDKIRVHYPSESYTVMATVLSNDIVSKRIYINIDKGFPTSDKIFDYKGRELKNFLLLNSKIIGLVTLTYKPNDLQAELLRHVETLDIPAIMETCERVKNQQFKQ